MKLKLFNVGLGLFSMLLACYLIWPEWFGFCELRDNGEGGKFCWSPYQRDIGDPLLYLSIAFLFIAVVVTWLERKAYFNWTIFSLVYGLIVLALLAYMPVIGGGLGGISLTFLDVEGLAKLYSVLYVVLSFAFFVIPDFFARSKRDKRQ